LTEPLTPAQAVNILQQQSYGNAQQLQTNQLPSKQTPHSKMRARQLQHKVSNLSKVNKALQRKLRTATSALNIQASVKSAQTKS